MKLSLRQLLPLLLISTSLMFTGCFEKKEEELPSTESGDGGGSATPPSNNYGYVTLSYPTVSGTYVNGVSHNFQAVSATTNIVSATLTNFTVSPSLPFGMLLNKSTGEISVDPNAGGVFGNWKTQNYTITAQKPDNEGPVTAVLNFGFSSDATPIDNSTAYSDLRYPNAELTLIVGQPMTPIVPTYAGPQDLAWFSSDGNSFSPMFGDLGLSFDHLTGTISGTPTQPVAKRVFSLTAANGDLAGSVAITIIEGAPTNLTYSNNNATYPVGYPITTNTPSASGGNIASFSVSPALPSGLTLNTTTGEITGTPTAITASSTYTITATNIAGSGSKQITIAVPNSAPAALSYVTVSARYTVGASITTNTPIVTGGGSPTSYSVNPALPAGLSLNTSNGYITGLPTAVTAAASYTVTASNAEGSANKVISIDVVNPGSHVLYATNGSSIKAYSVDEVTGEPIFVGKEISSAVTSKLVFHPTADCAFGYSGSAVASYSINKSANGELTSVSSSGGLSNPLNMVMTANGKFLFVVNNQDPLTQFVMKYEINSSNCSLSNAASTSVQYHTEHTVTDLATADNNLYVFYRSTKIRHLKFDTNLGTLTFQTDYTMSGHINPPQIGNSYLGTGLFLRANAAGTHLYASDSLKAIETFSLNVSGDLQSEGTGVDSGYFLSAPPVVDLVNDYYVTGLINGATNGAIKSIKIGANGLLGAAPVLEYNDVAAGYRTISTMGVHASQSGSYIYSTYTPASQATTAVRVKIESNGALTPKGLGIVGQISGY